MIHNDIQNQLQLLVKTSAPPLIEVADHPTETPQWTPGQSLPAHVIASLPNGRFQVAIENQILDMNLPRNTQPGEQLELTFIAAAPRMTFGLTKDLERALPTPTPRNSNVTLSDTAKYLGALIQRSAPPPAPVASGAAGNPGIPGNPGTATDPQGAGGAAHSAVSGNALNPAAPTVSGSPGNAAGSAVIGYSGGVNADAEHIGGFASANVAGKSLAAAAAELKAPVPITAGAPPPVKEFATALRNAVSQSGLFYESHQAQWVSGERTLATLLQEPQAQLTPLVARPQPFATPPVALSQQEGAATMPELQTKEVGMQQPVAMQHLDAVQARTEQHRALPEMRAGETVNMATSAPRDPVHPQAAPLVQQQLGALDGHQMFWHGQVWPGQTMDWEIDEDGTRHSEEDDVAPVWRTRLHLDMPQLGGVSAKLVLDHTGIQLDFAAERGESAQLIRSHMESLLRSMEASGLRLSGVMVHRNDEA